MIQGALEAAAAELYLRRHLSLQFDNNAVAIRFEPVRP